MTWNLLAIDPVLSLFSEQFWCTQRCLRSIRHVVIFLGGTPNTSETSQVLRRISCHGRKHSQASCEYSLTIFLCCQHHSEYSLLGSKFSTNLLFAASKCNVIMQQRGSSSVQNGRTGWDRCSGETLLVPCTREKRLQRKITKHYHWIGVQENIGMFSKS